MREKIKLPLSTVKSHIIYDIIVFSSVKEVMFLGRVRNLKFATYLKFATRENTNKINELW